MKKKLTLSSTRVSFDTHQTGFRSFTPINPFIPRILTPTVQEEHLLRMLQTPKKYSILSVPPKSAFATEKIIVPEVTNEKNFVATAEQVKICEPKNDKISLAKIKRIKRSYRSNFNPNEENLKAELQRLAENPVQRPVLVENFKIEEKSDIEKLLESQNFKKNVKNKKMFVSLQVQQVLTEGNDEEKDSEVEGAWRERDKILMNKSQTPTHTHTVKVNSKGSIFNENYKLRSHHIDINERRSLNYKESSWAVLKNTAFLANKIMKGIRNNAKVKFLSIY